MAKLSEDELNKIRQDVKNIALGIAVQMTPEEEEAAHQNRMTPAGGEEAEYAMDRFAIAQDSLFANHPMFSNPVSIYRQALTTYPIVPTYGSGSISFDGDKIYVSPEWYSERPLEELKFTTAWMAFLIARGHHKTGQDRKDEEGFSFYHWNTAANLLINRVMVDAKTGTLPQVGVFLTGIGNELNAETTIEEVYELIREKSERELNKLFWPLLAGKWIDYEELDVLDVDFPE